MRAWKIDARFNKVDLVRRIEKIAAYSNRIQLYNLDAQRFIESVVPVIPQKSLIYLDPPYYNKAQDLYENYYAKLDHAKIAGLVFHNISQPWIVSYDGVAEIVSLYEKHPAIYYDISYSAREHSIVSEVTFHNRDLVVPNVESPVKVKLPLVEIQ